MSGTLSDSALGDEVAVPSIEDSAPTENAAVDVDSGPTSQDKSVPADRFNGLMGRFNRTQNELSAAQARIAELEARLVAPPSQEPKESPVADTSQLEAQVSALSEMLMQERLENARKSVLEKYPEAAPFADLITADTPAGMEQVAQAIAERAKAAGLGGTTTTTTEPPASADLVPPSGADLEAPEAPPAPVVAGGTTFDSGAPTAEQVQDAIKRRDFAGFLAAKRASRQMTVAG